MDESRQLEVRALGSVAYGILAVRSLLPPTQREFADVAARTGIRYARANRLPFADGSVEVLYTSGELDLWERAEESAYVEG
jgi:hypothetical protein